MAVDTEEEGNCREDRFHEFGRVEKSQQCDTGCRGYL